MYHPSFGIVADYWLLGAVVAVFQRRHRAHRQSLGHPFRDSQARQPETPHHAGDALSGVIPQNNCGTLRLPKRHCARTLHLLQFRPVFIRQNQLGSPRFTCHAQAYQETILFVYVLMKRYTSCRAISRSRWSKRWSRRRVVWSGSPRRYISRRWRVAVFSPPISAYRLALG